MSSCRQPVYSDLVSFAFQKATPYGEQRPLFIDAEDESVFFDACQFRRLVRRLVAGWQACIPCLQAGDCVLVHLGNSVCMSAWLCVYVVANKLSAKWQILYPAIFFSVVGAGAVYMGSNPRSHELELEHLLQLAEPKLIVTGREALPLVLEVSAARGMLPSQVAVLDEPQVMAHLAGLGLLGRQSAGPTALAEAIAKTGRREIDGQDQNQSQSPHQQAPQPAKAISFADLLCHGETDWAAFDDAAVATSTPAAMFCTSGTGGMPKAAVLSHQTVVSQHLAIQYEVPYRVSRLISLPMFHLFGALWTHMFPLRYGQPLFVLPRFEPDQFLVAVHRHRVTETYLVPAMVHSIRKRSGRDAAAAAAAGDADADADASSLDTATLLSSLRYVGVAGAPIDGGSMRQFARLLHRDARACQLWGMTETGVAFQSRYTDQGSSRTGPDDTAASIGRLLGGYEVRLLRSSSTGGRRDEHGDSQPGELLLRGSGLMQGYRGHNGSDDADGAQGWFRTGDVAYVKNGWYYLVGRTKELIKVRG